MPKTVEGALRFFNFLFAKFQKKFIASVKKDRAHRNQKGNSLRMYGPGYRGGLSKR